MNRHLLLIDMIVDALERIESNPYHTAYVEMQKGKIKEWEKELSTMELEKEQNLYVNEYLNEVKAVTLCTY